MSEIIAHVIVAPEGVVIDALEAVLFSNTRDYCVSVVWRGKGRYAVIRGMGNDGMEWLSRAGNWSWGSPQPFQRRQYRFTYDEAIKWARRVVGDLRVQGQSYAEMLAWMESVKEK